MHPKRIVKPSFKVKNGAAASRKPKVNPHKRQASLASHDEELSSHHPPRGPSQKRSKSGHIAPEEVSDHDTSEHEPEVVEINQSEDEVNIRTSWIQFHDSHYV
jgi:hypothetical protein